jgi:hypothetical protein
LRFWDLGSFPSFVQCSLCQFREYAIVRNAVQLSKSVLMDDDIQSAITTNFDKAIEVDK